MHSLITLRTSERKLNSFFNSTFGKYFLEATDSDQTEAENRYFPRAT